MSIKNVPVCEHKLTSAICASVPQVRADRVTGEIRTDRASGLPQYEVFVLVSFVDEREPSVINVRVAGEPVGLEIGKPVRLFDLYERKWEVDGRSGENYTVSAITAADAAPSAPPASAPAESSAPGRGGGSKAAAS